MVNFEYNFYFFVLIIVDFILVIFIVFGNFFFFIIIKLDFVRCFWIYVIYLIVNLFLSDLFVGFIIGYGCGLVGCFMYKDEI